MAVYPRDQLVGPFEPVVPGTRLGHDRPPSTTNRAGRSAIFTRMRSSGMPAMRLLLEEMSGARRILSASARPERITPVISRGWDAVASVNTLVAGSCSKATCTNEVGAPGDGGVDLRDLGGHSRLGVVSDGLGGGNADVDRHGMFPFSASDSTRQARS
jgi:hypothetical protein